MSNPIIGTAIHAIGGLSASSCYIPFHRTRNWSWGSFWLIQALFAWILMPLMVGWLTVPRFFTVLAEAPPAALCPAFLLGAVYGFGSMSFGMAIRHIGYSLTYTLSIGISAVLGTLMPLLIFGGWQKYFCRPGGMTVLVGMMLSVLGVALCGWAGFRKEKEISRMEGMKTEFNMISGLILAIIGGVLSGVFNISLEYGQPIADMAAGYGAGRFEGNAKLIVSTSGCWLVNLIWFTVAGIRQKTLGEFVPNTRLHASVILKNVMWSAMAGTLWFFQFFFYGLGHIQMGKFQFASWVMHMSMLIFFSYVIGVIRKEWKNLSRKTYILLMTALIILIASFCIIASGSMPG
ncbi:MAG: L-rhamnose/proton symporter RhaT [Mangrovibacterium sp.]